MRQRVALTALTAAACVAAVVGVSSLQGSDAERRAAGTGKLQWERAPVLVADIGRTGDRVLVGRVRNASRHRLDLRSGDVRVLDASGRRVPAYARYAAGYAHGLYGAYPGVRRQPASDLRRLGFVVALETGETAPLFVAFRAGAGRPPFRVDYRPLTEPLPVPARAKRARAEARLGG